MQVPICPADDERFTLYFYGDSMVIIKDSLLPDVCQRTCKPAAVSVTPPTSHYEAHASMSCMSYESHLSPEGPPLFVTRRRVGGEMGRPSLRNTRNTAKRARSQHPPGKTLPPGKLPLCLSVPTATPSGPPSPRSISSRWEVSPTLGLPPPLSRTDT